MNSAMPRILLLLLLILSCQLSNAQKTFIHCGKLIDVDNSKLLDNQTITVEADRIIAITKGKLTGGDNDIFIDLSDKTVLPGLMDMHIHIEHESSPKRYEETFRQNDADVALQATLYCQRTLDAGFTSVRDLGGTGVNVSLRNAINAGHIRGPRIYTAEKSLATTGGHADPTNGVRKDLTKDPGPKEGVVNSEEDAYKAVRQRYKNGADCIKITATGGVLSVAKDGSGPQFTVDEIKAVVEAAKDYGYVTAAHAHGKEGMKRAILAGINSIEHGTLMDIEIMDLMIKHGTYLVPTISAGKFVADKAKIKGFYPSVIVPKALAIGPKLQETFAAAYKRGVKIAFGTDAGVSRHGLNALEFGFMVEAGMPEMEAIRTATVYASDLMRVNDELGSIAVGKYADIIAVKGNPLEDIDVLNDVKWIMKNGKVEKE